MIFRYKIPSWNGITVEMYQYLIEIQEADMDQLDKILYQITALCKTTEEKLNKISVKEFNRLSSSLAKKLDKMEGKAVDKLKGFKFNYDFKNVTLGQYIEVNHFLREGQMNNLHYLAASICKKKGLDHEQRANEILKLPVIPVSYSVAKYVEEFKKFNDSYKGLFGLDDEDEIDEIDDVVEFERSLNKDDFNSRYGWIYSTKKVAEFAGIKVEEAYDLPVIQAFNYLSYLKAYNEWEKEQHKKEMDKLKR